MSQIFISYSHGDRAKAQLLAEALERVGWSVWWDRQILAGKTFDEIIERALDAAKCVMVLWSKESVLSQWVRIEAAEGKDRNILIPVMIDEVRVPLEFRRIQTARLINWQGGSSPELEHLIQSIESMLGQPEKAKLDDTTITYTLPDGVKKQEGDSRGETLSAAVEAGKQAYLEEKTRNKIVEIIVIELGVDESEVVPNARFVDDLGADSLDTVELIMKFEEEFGIIIPDEDAVEILTVRDAFNYAAMHVKS